MSIAAAQSLAAEVLRLGGGRQLAVGTPVDFVYRTEVCGPMPLSKCRGQCDDDTFLLPEGEPQILLETHGHDAKISTRQHGDVWTFLAHLRPARKEER